MHVTQSQCEHATAFFVCVSTLLNACFLCLSFVETVAIADDAWQLPNILQLGVLLRKTPPAGAALTIPPRAKGNSRDSYSAADGQGGNELTTLGACAGCDPPKKTCSAGQLASFQVLGGNSAAAILAGSTAIPVPQWCWRCAGRGTNIDGATTCAPQRATGPPRWLR